MQTIETQFRQYHVTKVGGGLEPLGPIGVYAYAFWYWLTRVVPEKGPLNVCVCVCVIPADLQFTTLRQKSTSLLTVSGV